MGEVRNQLYIALTVNYMAKSEFESLNRELIDLSNQIGSFINYLVTKRRNKEFLTR